MHPPTPDAVPGPPPPIDEARERRMALALTGVVLLTLTVVKPLGAVPYVGAIGYTLAAALQLYLPLWRSDSLRQPTAFVGLHLGAWRRDVKLVLVLCLVSFPPYAFLHHLYMTGLHDLVGSVGLGELARFIPRAHLAPAAPAGGWLSAGAWLAGLVATHALGVALPEETFYRGYLQARLETLWPPRRRVLGVRLGLAAVVAAACFASGHFLGEWNPLRLGPFLPALVFAWQRNATGSIVGAIGFHAACNVYGELLYRLYRPI
jgi:membrane protease YdiL (CAAX protease family)